MRLKILIIFLFSPGFILNVNNYAFAHKVNLFCYLEEGILMGEGYYRGGNPVRNSKIEVYSLNLNELLVKTQTDDKGKFSVKLDNTGSFKVVMNAGQGHKAEFIIEQKKNVLSEDNTPADDKTILQSEIQRLIDKRIKPLKDRIRNLEKQQSEPRIISVMGGIGLITFIFTLIYLIKKKHAL